MTPLLSLRNVRRTYGSGDATVHALDGVDLDVWSGEFVSLMGASGSGKSTALNILGCLDAPTSGLYAFRGVDVGTLDRAGRALFRRHYLGFVFQSFHLLERTSAVENVELPMIYRGVPAAERRRRAVDALRQVGLGDRLGHVPAQLSGGQQQRVAIARAIVAEPQLLLADEPTGNLDSRNTEEVVSLLGQLNKERGITIVMVTHEPEVAARTSRIVTFRDGRIIADAPVLAEVAS